MAQHISMLPGASLKDRHKASYAMATFSLSDNQRAVKVQSYSLASCLAALVCAGGLTVVALMGIIAIRMSRWLRRVTQVLTT